MKWQKNFLNKSYLHLDSLAKLWNCLNHLLIEFNNWKNQLIILKIMNIILVLQRAQIINHFYQGLLTINFIKRISKLHKNYSIPISLDKSQAQVNLEVQIDIC